MTQIALQLLVKGHVSLRLCRVFAVGNSICSGGGLTSLQSRNESCGRSPHPLATMRFSAHDHATQCLLRVSTPTICPRYVSASLLVPTHPPQSRHLAHIGGMAATHLRLTSGSHSRHPSAIAPGQRSDRAIYSTPPRSAIVPRSFGLQYTQFAARALCPSTHITCALGSPSGDSGACLRDLGKGDRGTPCRSPSEFPIPRSRLPDPRSLFPDPHSLLLDPCVLFPVLRAHHHMARTTALPALLPAVRRTSRLPSLLSLNW